MYNNLMRYPAENPLAIYHAVMSKDRRITLPKGCLLDMHPNDDGSYPAVLSNSFEDNCIFICTREHFKVITGNLASLNAMDPAMRIIKRRILGDAVELCADKRRRIRIYSRFMETLGFDGCRPFSVTILKYPEMIKIVPADGYKDLTLQN